MKAIFLDRDGVINKDAKKGDYIKSWEEFKFLPGSIMALKKLKESGYEVFVFSNQAGVSKGLYTKKALDRLTKNMLKEIKRKGADIRGVNYCIHRLEDNCNCRKPNIGMIKTATKGLHIDFNKTYFIGDTKRDVEAGKNAGCKTILLTTGKEDVNDVKDWEIRPDFIKKNLKEAVEWVLEEGQR